MLRGTRNYFNYNLDTHTFEEKTHYGPGSRYYQLDITSAVQTAGYRISMFNILNLSPGCDIVRSTLGETYCVAGEELLGGGLEGGRGRLTEFTVRLAAAPSLHQSEHRVSGGSTNHRPACSCIQCRKAELGWPWQDSVQNIDRVWSHTGQHHLLQQLQEPAQVVT